jgi:hypothetical protein
VVPAVAVAAAGWSLAPVAAWWDGAELGYFAAAWRTWMWGLLVTVLLTAVILVLTRGRAATAAAGAWRRVMAWPARGFAIGAGLTLAVLALAACLLVFAGNPRNVDGFAQLFQARIFQAGRLWLPPPAELAHFATLQMIVGPERWYAQYPPGQSLLLAAGLAAGVWWLLNPLLAAALAVGSYRVARWCGDEAAARLAAVLLCLSPFVVMVAGSEMSHLAAATLGMTAAAAATGAGGSRSWRTACAAGLALGTMTAFRPLDAVAAAVPVGLMLLMAGGNRAAALGAAAAGGVIGTLPTLWYNANTTGSWRTFGYVALWGPQHSLGFHDVPWGVPLTLPRAIARTGLDLHQLNLYLIDLPVPVLAVLALALVAARRSLAARDAVPLAGVAALAGLLFFYWHRDVFYGPRFLYTALPWLVILLARAVTLVSRTGRAIRPAVTAGRAAAFAVLVAIAVGLVAITPGRVAAYRRATPIFNLHPDRDAERVGISNAVVVIPDGWGSRLIVRMWALGVPVRRSNRLYARIDACTLEQALGRAEREPAAQARLLATLDSLAALGRPGLPSDATEDPNLRLLPDGELAPACREEIAFDRGGALAFAPFLYLNSARLDGDVVWARDLGPRNAALFARYPGRRYYRYAPPAPGQPPVFTPLDVTGAER